MAKTQKQKRLEALRHLIISKALKEREHAKLVIEDTDGTMIPVMSDEALPAIERRLTAMEDK